MKTTKRTAQTPWQVIDLNTDECTGWYDTEVNAIRDNLSRQFDTYYRPLRKKVSR
jgi:hypothetical protein